MMQMRHERIDTCAECGECDSKILCEPVRCKLRKYNGIRFTSDGFDCALPVAIDSHSHCSYGCLYCFSDNLMAHRKQTARTIGQTSLKQIELLFSGDDKGGRDLFQKALKYDQLDNVQKYPCPVQVGGICDPCDNIERQQGWLLEFIRLAIKYNQPVRISTKGNIFLLKEYLRELEKAPHLFWVAFSIITSDDELLSKIDLRAPSATVRLKCMERLASIGVKTSLRFRPIIPGISDSTKTEPEAWKTLIAKAASSGACAISYEVAFVPYRITDDIKRRWHKLSSLVGHDLMKLYHSFGPKASCMRPPYTWTENIMHAIAEEAHKYGMTVGVSDPVWKQLCDTGCCCGILPDDPVFGNWQRESATNQLLLARDVGKELSVSDIIPAWAYKAGVDNFERIEAGPKEVYYRHHIKWSDKLTAQWNDLRGNRGPLGYFQGALLPVRRDKDGNMVYTYAGLNKQYKEQSEWIVNQPRDNDKSKVLPRHAAAKGNLG